MKRTSIDEVNYCIAKNECFDCHSNDKVETAVDFQKRGKFRVPCCRKHFNASKSRRSKANAKKYARSSAIKRGAGECTYKGCHHKLIPQELLPTWWKRETTCGMHSPFKAFRVNRAAIVRFIIEHYVSAGLAEGMEAQNIIYHPGEGYILFGLAKPGAYLTRGFSASDLLKRYEQFRRQQSLSV